MREHAVIATETRVTRDIRQHEFIQPDLVSQPGIQRLQSLISVHLVLVSPVLIAAQTDLPPAVQEGSLVW